MCKSTCLLIIFMAYYAVYPVECVNKDIMRTITATARNSTVQNQPRFVNRDTKLDRNQERAIVKTTTESVSRLDKSDNHDEFKNYDRNAFETLLYRADNRQTEKNDPIVFPTEKYEKEEFSRGETTTPLIEVITRFIIDAPPRCSDGQVVKNGRCRTSQT